MKKVLIFYNREKLEFTGGPAGYLANLNEGLVKLNINNICFMDGFNKRKTIKKFFKLLPKQMQIKYQQKKRLYHYKSMLNKKKSSSISHFEEINAIHFHETTTLYENRHLLDNYTGKVIVQSHSPVPSYLEQIDRAVGKEKEFYKNNIDKLKNIEEYAFNRADYIVFPCPEAEEPYYKHMDIYSAIHEKNAHKYKYLLSGIKDVRKKFTDIRMKYNIPDNAFVITYVGRHNKIKGYDILKKIGHQMLNENPNLYILVAGNESPLSGINHTRWIEVGWTRDPHSVIAAGDLFILPNKETYFDLILLEVLSVGQIILTSRTGGNKYFEQYKNEGIFLYDTYKECLDIINHIQNLDSNARRKLRENNRKLYEDLFSIEIFTRNYIQMLHEIEAL